MTRFRRRLLTVFAALSLMLCLGTLAAWRRSYRLYGTPEVRIAGRVFAVGWSAGTMSAYTCAPMVGWGRPPYGYELIQHPPLDVEQSLRSPRSSGGVVVRSIAGFGCYRTTRERAVHGVFAPAWSLALATAAFPLWWLPREFKRGRVARRHRAGLCPQCGYDLRASPQRCPECGLATAPAPSVTSPT